jgi:nucleotide-binding universal stress UspA family protein
MALKDLLLQLSSYPEPTQQEPVEQAVRFAELLGARMSALTFEIDIHVPSNPLAVAVLDLPAMIAAEESKSASNAKDLVTAFSAAADKQGVPAEHFIERCAPARMPDLVVEYARLRDLTIIPVGEPAVFQQPIAETVIFGSGRPVLILPDDRQKFKPISLDTLGIAWDFSGPAARAIADALPLLQRAQSIRVVTVTNEKTIEARRRGSDLARHLAVHGVEVILEEEDAAGRAVGEVLDAYCRERELDLLVMGAYGHSRAREFILGGATRSILRTPPLPVLLSH